MYVTYYSDGKMINFICNKIVIYLITISISHKIKFAYPFLGHFLLHKFRTKSNLAIIVLIIDCIVLCVFHLMLFSSMFLYFFFFFYYIIIFLKHIIGTNQCLLDHMQPFASIFDSE